MYLSWRVVLMSFFCMHISWHKCTQVLCSKNEEVCTFQDTARNILSVCEVEAKEPCVFDMFYRLVSQYYKLGCLRFD